MQLTVIGRTGDLPWFALESSTPERDARALARRMSRRGRVSLVLALHPPTQRLTIAVAFERIPHISFNLGAPGPEALEALSRLGRLPEGGALAFAAMAADALSAEPVGRRFFREFRTTLGRMAAGLPGAMAGEDRHSMALLQLTRVLFLYFVQAKGWLAGRERFLSEEVDRCLLHRRRIHRDLLRPLFFGTLNRPASSRSRTAAAFGRIPFLNGGLFEPHPLERRLRCDIPNTLWCTAFDLLFERFHFTVSEAGDRGSVAPDMLGQVFEGVMEPDARHASGTFYTPASLVQQVLDAALIALVSARLTCGEAEAEQRIRDHDHAVAQALESITLLDPAVGSGAFLLCALERLSAAAIRPRTLVQRKRRVLQQNLFGVDRNAAAVRLTELRLWLATIADDPAGCADEVNPLPNLDCLIRQGDSLFDPMGPGVLGASSPHHPSILAELTRLRSDVVTATGSEKRALVRRLRVAELHAFAETLDAAEVRRRSQITECLQDARSIDLFGRSRGLDLQLKRRLSPLRAELRRLRQIHRQLTREGEIPWFHYQSQFADVFARGGFDLVLGNPPWLRSECMPIETRNLLAARYSWWRTPKANYGNSPDLAIAFLERALELASPDGVVAMLVPAKITSAGYATAARHALASTTTLHAVADLTENPAADFAATVYPLALVARKSAPPPEHRVRSALPVVDGSRVKQAELRGGGPWILSRSPARRVISKLEGEFPPLANRLTCHLGLKTGLNRVFLNPPERLEAEVIRWAIRGRDINAFGCRCSARLLWTHDAAGLPRRELPTRARAYLAAHDAALRARRDFQGGPPWTVFRARAAASRYRVVWPDLARLLAAAALTSAADLNCIPLNSCYVIAVRNAEAAEGLAAWLNSTWIRAVARLGAMPASGGFARFSARVVSHLPLPDSTLADPGLAQFARKARTGNMVQDELDTLVAQHLGLSKRAQSALRAVVDYRADHRR